MTYAKHSSGKFLIFAIYYAALLCHLRFADDIIIFTRNIAELHEMLQELNQASLEVGLSMNFKKTKIMCNKHAEDTNRKITIDNN